MNSPSTIRQRILERDGYCCQMCSGGDHIDRLRVFRKDGNPDNIADDNLVLLCKDCINLVHSKAGRRSLMRLGLDALLGSGRSCQEG